ncbi:MAG: hypothetical protein KGJ59_05495 [Bacteroidota bacterium]|nr:hypothetical protein [Bacteroidota bacterium]
MRRRQFFTDVAILLVTGLFSCTNPNAPETTYTVTVSGTVLRKSSFPLDSVQIVVDKPFVRDSVASDGKFKISFSSLDKNPGSSNLAFSRSRFYDTTISVSYSATASTVDLGTIVMVSQDSSENVATPGKPSAHANKIAFLGSSVSNLSINGAGGDDIATLTFEVRDSAGNPVDASNSVMVHFTFVSRPDSVTGFNHDSVQTDISGRAAVLLIAGKKSGIAQVQASARIDSLHLTLMSQTISIPIYGGQADSSHFTLAMGKRNIPGGVLANVRDQITALLGDSAGNPAQPGTVVYFSTNGGVIQPSGTSTHDGEVTVDLITGNPFPPGGVATVTASVGSSNNIGSVAPGGSGRKSVLSTFKKKSSKGALLSKIYGDEFETEQVSSQSSTNNSIGFSGIQSSNSNGATIAAVFSQKIHILFSGKTVISLNAPNDSNFVVPLNDVKTINYTVADQQGNPLTEGTTISVTSDAGSDVELSGDVSTTLPDTQDKTYTAFSVNVKDKRDSVTAPKAFKVTIKVSSENGNSTMTLQGALESSATTGGNVSRVIFVKSTSDTIVVAGIGSSTTDTVTFQVLDNFNAPVAGVPVQFFFSTPLQASEYVSPSFALSDAAGKVKTVVNSGVRSGLMRVAAKVASGNFTVTSPGVPVYVKTGPLATIAFISTSASELSVKGVGGTETALVVFEARDALGNPLDFANQTQINFSILGGPGSGEVVQPASRLTDPFTGRVTTTLTAGTKATVLQVVASNTGGTIASSPVPIIIDGGFADQAHFTFLAPPKNLSTVAGGSVPVKIHAGDQFGNPVKLGTSVYFSATGGSISAAAQTDASGQASATLQVMPPSGLVYVKARTVGINGATVADSAGIIFSGAPVITVQNVPTDTMILSDGGFADVNYKVADLFGNPISKANTISVTVSGTKSSDIALSGDVNVAMPETQDTVQGTTKFTFRAADKFPGSGTSGTFLITITSTGESGTVVKLLQGVLLGPGDIIVPPSVRQPAQIAFLGITSSDISVAGVGGTENSVITYEVRDSLGQPIDKSQRAYATFSAQFFPNSTIGGGISPRLIPAADSTDDQGRLHVSVVSGTQAGVLQVLVIIQLPSRTIQSSPVKISVHAGMPDQGHFTLATSRWVFPTTTNISTPVLQFTVLAGDTFSNPVDAGTAVYFHSQAGVIQTGTVTDQDGFVSNSLYDGNPSPDVSYDPTYGKGYFWVYAQTQGNYNKAVIDSLLVVRAIAPIVLTGIPDSVSVPVNGASAPISITVKDGNGNPLPDGTTISVSVVPPSNPPTGFDVGTSGDVSVTIPNAAYARFPGSQITNFTFRVVDNSTAAFIGTTVTVVVTVNSHSLGIGTRSKSFIARLQ